MDEEAIKEVISERQNQILLIAYHDQYDEDGNSKADEFVPLTGYKHLEKETGISKDRLKPEVIELRNWGMLALAMAVDCDYFPSGSGYEITDKGVEYVKKNLLGDWKEF